MRYDENVTKRRTAVWLNPETMERMDRTFPTASCKNRSEFIEKALDFYCGYINSQQSTNYLHPMILQSIRGTLKENEHRMNGNLFRLTVEMSMMMHILAARLEISDGELTKLRGHCVNLVKKSKGIIKMDDAIRNQDVD